MIDLMKAFSLVMPLTKRHIDVTISYCTKIVESADVKIVDLKTRKIKHQKSTSDSESEEDEESISIQAEEERNEENEEMQEEDMDIVESEEDHQEKVTREESPQKEYKDTFKESLEKSP